jgi:hypothetical protein
LTEVYDKKIHTWPFPYHLDYNYSAFDWVSGSGWYPGWYGIGNVVIYLSPHPHPHTRTHSHAPTHTRMTLFSSLSIVSIFVYFERGEGSWHKLYSIHLPVKRTWFFCLALVQDKKISHRSKEELVCLKSEKQESQNLALRHKQWK